MTDKLQSAPLAYENEKFLSSPDGRFLRILAEYSEPLTRFRREQIQDTVVFFGSARFNSHAAAQQDLSKVQREAARLAKGKRSHRTKSHGGSEHGAILRRRAAFGVYVDHVAMEIPPRRRRFVVTTGGGRDHGGGQPGCA